MGWKNGLFDVSVALTIDGWKNWKTVVREVNAAIAQVAGQPLPSHILESINRMRAIDWDWQQRDDGGCVQDFALMLRKEPFETFPEHNWFLSESTVISPLLDLLTPEKSFITLMSQEEPLGNTFTEPWMNVSYGVRPFSETEKKELLNGETMSTSMPAPNAFIPSSALEVLPLPETGAVNEPFKLKEEDLGVLYYHRDNEFLVPKAYVKYLIRTPAIRPGDARSLCLARLYTRFVSEAFNEVGYCAGLAGLHVDVALSDNVGISVTLDGYSSKAMTLFEEAVSIMMEPSKMELREDKFLEYREDISRGWKNRAKASPLAQAYEGISCRDFFNVA